MDLGPQTQLAYDALLARPTRGIPTWCVHLMEHALLERVAGAPRGTYRRDPVGVYLAGQRAMGVCLIDQFIPDNPLTMGDRGFEGSARGATTGAGRTELDGMVIDSPEAVVGHLERVVFPQLAETARNFDEAARTLQVLEEEAAVQAQFGPDLLKCPYAVTSFPCFAYNAYGYEHYFAAYALYPEVMEQHFALQADLALRNNRALAHAYQQGNLPPLCRLDHDMAGSRGLLVDVRSLDRLWLPHFARCLEPLLEAGVRLVWHCDGNLMELVPRLLEAGVSGFQGFQYEAGMDYPRLCRMRARDGDELLIIAGVSVSRTLPFGTPSEVKRELDWLVEHGPRTGLFLGASSTICPRTPWENVATLLEGLRHYRERGRGSIY